MKVILLEDEKKKRDIYRIEKNCIVLLSGGQLVKISNTEIKSIELDNGDIIEIKHRKYGNS